ncbi:MAG: DNA-directed RNA polymerase subunit omega, partial [Crocinitomicaceae bacterium]
MSIKNTTGEKTTVTRDTILLEEKTGNIYQSLVAISKRANQISAETKEELTQKLQEFASSTDNLEEIF